ncbi:transporter substrate-binding domain-containing protein [Aquabacter sp. CN5-332]|uniref:substrate-binding periplasmic protein n=1 Tax=Aquabacter sp. CN5-332 TaxID=3156608 RepID=UPI0032B37790
MNDDGKLNKRNFLTAAAIAGAGLPLLSGMSTPARAQLLDTGISPDSMLSKLKKGGTLRIGYAQNPLWFYKDPKTGELQGIYKDLADQLASDLEMKAEYQEVNFGNATVALRKGDFDLLAASFTFTAARGLVVNFIGPIWTKGSLAIVHKDDADKYKTLADLNNENVTISVSAGATEEARMPLLFPKAKVLSVAGQQALAAEPVRARRATAYWTGDIDILSLAKRNSWAHVIDPDHPFDKRPNTWAIRYGDEPWKNFLDMWVATVLATGQVQALYKSYVERFT